MCFYLQGRKVSDGKPFTVDREFWTIEAALEAARSRLQLDAAHMWIMDHQQRLILSFQEVRDRLQSEAVAASAIQHEAF
ncbi:hypothetical protein [Methylocystis parvus]|uniref:Uncharacterized protein n=1 Tax=Methylocystis parvus TaxID=134 RepID=A0A6B8M3I3_9HYPH|nr:hypothetical protein [Methylocystis parvus]QGM97451.1 hypothetical protein F7D14_08220 [Methylocystis parvus]WBJ98629.1 hypothetical protein MMG94_11385 [Methylocystis parvus OBBP]